MYPEVTNDKLLLDTIVCTEGFWFDLEVIKAAVEVPEPASGWAVIMYKALSVALSITTKKVAFIGLDNNYFKYIKIDKFNKLWINTGNHFYDNESQYVYSSNHFPMGYSQFIKNLYLQVRSLGNFPKDRIYNLDKDSLTDNFEKIELEEFV